MNFDNFHDRREPNNRRALPASAAKKTSEQAGAPQELDVAKGCWIQEGTLRTSASRPSE
jgi:hypothetical protein